jgi:hypothetical protein
MMERLNRWGPLSGVVFVALLAVTIFAFPSTPDVNASTAKIVGFYASHRGALQAQAYTLAYAAVFLVWFYVLFAARLRRMGANALATAVVVGVAIMAVAMGIGAALNIAMTHRTAPLSASSAQAMNLLNNDLPFIALFTGLLITMLTVGVAVLRTEALPKYMGWIAVVIGVLVATGTWLAWIGLMASGLWTVAASVMVYLDPQDADVMAPTTGGSDRIPAQSQAQASESGMAIGG